jgi:transcriptional regulator with XRE-family HTH domain
MGYHTGEQIRAARAMLGWEQSELAERAGVSIKTIKRMEATNGRIVGHSEWSVVRALELGGIEFVGDHDWQDRTDGVRFAKDKSARVRRKILETVSRHLDYELKEKAQEDPEFFDRETDDIVKMVIGNVEKELRESVVDIFRRNEERSA